MTKEASLNAEKELNAARFKGNEMMEEVKNRAENEVLLMKEMLKDKEQAAIRLVISTII
jgi:hypothetical protein